MTEKATNLTVRTFAMDTDKEAALKPLEEAAEVFAAWQIWEPNSKEVHCQGIDCAECAMSEHCDTYLLPNLVRADKDHLADEIADCIQACCNLAARYDIDLQAAMERCELRNRKRGRCQ